MNATQQQSGKVCVMCGADVANAPRVKDAQGRYVCSACVERLKASQGRNPRITKVEGTRAVAARVGRDEPASDQGADIREFMAQAQRAAKNQCPSCHAFAAPDAIICVNCGYDSRTQAQLQTKFGRARVAGKSSIPLGLIGAIAGAVIVIGGVLYFFLGMNGAETISNLISGG